ncbi:Apulose-4-phosphate transketolase subunit A [subsurface metagenome]
MFAHHRKLDNLISFVDANKKQLDGYIKDINDLGNISEKFASFGWYAQDVDGSDIAKIYEAIEKAKEIKKQPSVIILDTIKGQGLKFVEETMANHHMIFSVADHKEADKCIVELENKLKEY